MDQPAASNAVEPAEFVRALAEENFAVRDGELWVEESPVSRLADRYGTPLFVYSAAAIDRACGRVRQCLPDRMGLFYSVKANPSRALLRLLLQRCDGLEIASSGELVKALSSGCDPSRILFAGPGKTDTDLWRAVAAGVHEIHVESRGEVERLSRIVARSNATVRVSVRINPDASVQGGSMRMGGRPTAFGVDEEQLPDVVGCILAEPRLHLAGVHVYAGTQVLDAAVLLVQYRHALVIARRMADLRGRPLESIDFGGGWGVPLFPHETPLDLDSLRTGLIALMDELQSDPRLASARPLVEPGRFLVASSGIYVTRVVDVKTSHGTTFVILDGGMNHHLAASGNLGQTIKRNFPIAVLNRMDEPPAGPVELSGPLCTPLDTLARRIALPAVQPGDLIGILQSGAYARSASPNGFLSHSSPPEVLVAKRNSRLIARRGPT